MNDVNNGKGMEKLNGLNNTLLGVENKLIHRSLDRSRADAENAYDFINQAAEAGVVDIGCSDCSDEPEQGESLPHMSLSGEE